MQCSRGRGCEEWQESVGIYVKADGNAVLDVKPLPDGINSYADALSYRAAGVLRMQLEHNVTDVTLFHSRDEGFKRSVYTNKAGQRCQHTG